MNIAAICRVVDDNAFIYLVREQPLEWGEARGNMSNMKSDYMVLLCIKKEFLS